MESLYLLIPVSIVLVFMIAGLFWWSVKSGQFDDLEGPAHRILMDLMWLKGQNRGGHLLEIQIQTRVCRTKGRVAAQRFLICVKK